jgi:hypothetical protein
MITYEQRELAFEHSTELQKKMYATPEGGEAIARIATAHQLPKQLWVPFAIAVGDVILGLVPQEKIPQLLVERLSISQSDAMRITADILDYLEPLNQSSQIHPISGSTGMQSIQPTDSQTTSTPSSDASLAAELAETEAVFKQLQPIRTMAHDMETIKTKEEPVHQATSQDTILNGQGNAQKNPDARWETPEK